MKKIVKNILIILSYFVYEYIFIFLLSGLNINFFNLDYDKKVAILSIINFTYIVFLLIMYKDEIREDSKDFKENYKTYLNQYAFIYVFGVLLMGLSNALLQHITNLEMSGNETQVRDLISRFPVYMTYSSIIYAPFVEEIIFRKSIKNIINKGSLFVIISGIIFGVLHISDYTKMGEILMGIPYIIMGIDFAYIYQKTNNIFTTMTFHFIHNAILLLIVFI